MQITTPRTRRTGGRSARVHTAVLAATIDVLLDRGIDGLTIAEIAERAGVHETTVYRRWGTKANLALEAVLSTSILEIPAPNTNSLRGDLLALLHGVARSPEPRSARFSCGSHYARTYLSTTMPGPRSGQSATRLHMQHSNELRHEASCALASITDLPTRC